MYRHCVNALFTIKYNSNTMITYSMNNDLLLNKSDIKQAVVSITTKLSQQVTKYKTRVH